MPRSRIPSPARSQGVISTPRRHKTRRSHSVCSPTSKNMSVPLSALVTDSFKISPMPNRQSILTDDTDIEIQPGRQSWWKRLGENSTEIMDVPGNSDVVQINNLADEFDVEVLSQEKQQYTLDLPESSDKESISSIVVPQRKLFPQKENNPQKKFAQIMNDIDCQKRISHIEPVKDIEIAPKSLFKQPKQRSKPVFPFGLLNISTNKTLNKSKEMPAPEVKSRVRSLFGNQPAIKRKNMFADFIVSDNEDDIPDIQPTSTDSEMEEWRLLPSSTIMGNQLEDITPVKRARLSKLSEMKESKTVRTTNNTKQFNKSKESKNKLKILSNSKLREIEALQQQDTVCEEETNLSNSRHTRNRSRSVQETSLIKAHSSKTSNISKNITIKDKDVANKTPVNEKKLSVNGGNEIEDNDNEDFTLEYENDDDIVKDTDSSNMQNKFENKNKTVTHFKTKENLNITNNKHKSINNTLNFENNIVNESETKDIIRIDYLSPHKNENIEESQNENHDEVNKSNEDEESISSIVVPQRKLFPQKENNPQKKFAQIMNDIDCQNRISHIEPVKDIEIAPKSLFKQRSKPVFPFGLLNISTNKTLNKSKEMPAPEVKSRVRSLFGNQPAIKRKNMFADFIVSDSEDDIPDIQPTIFAFKKNVEEKRKESTSSRHSLTTSTDSEMEEWRLLPSSTIMGNQLEDITPVKRARLSKLSEMKESTTVRTINNTKQFNKSEESKNKLKILSNSKLREIEALQQQDTVCEEETNLSNSRHTRNRSRSVQETSVIKAQSPKTSNISKNITIKDKDVANKTPVNEKKLSVNGGNEIEDNDNEDFTLEYENDDDIVKDTDSSNMQNKFENKNKTVTHFKRKENLNITNNKHKSINNPLNIENNIVNESETKDITRIDYLSPHKNENIEKSQNENQDEVNKSNEEMEVEGNVEDDESESDIIMKIRNNEKNVTENEETCDNDGEQNEEDDEQLEDDNQNEEHNGLENKDDAAVNENNESPDITNKKEELISDEVISPEAVLHDKTNRINSFTVQGRNTTARKNKSSLLKTRIHIRPSLAPARESTGFSDGTRESSADNSGWDSHRTTRKTLRQTFGKDFTFRKSLRTLVMEKSAKRNTNYIEKADLTDIDNLKVPQANSTEFPHFNQYEEEPMHVDETSEEISKESEDPEIPQDLEEHKGVEETEDHEESDQYGGIEELEESETEEYENPEDHDESEEHEETEELDGNEEREEREASETEEHESQDDHDESGEHEESEELDGHKEREELEESETEEHEKQEDRDESGEQEKTEALDGHEEREKHQELEEHEVSKRTRQTTLELYLQKIKLKNLEKKRIVQERVKNSIKITQQYDPFKVPKKPAPRIQTKDKSKKNEKNKILLSLPAEVIADIKYKPPKRFKPSNASWVTKRLYKFLETKLEPKYDYRARVRAEKLVETIYNFTKVIKKHYVAPSHFVDELKNEMARLDIVKTHFDFYEFFNNYMPREIRIKVIPDIVNKISLPRHGVFSDIEL